MARECYLGSFDDAHQFTNYIALTTTAAAAADGWHGNDGAAAGGGVTVRLRGRAWWPAVGSASNELGQA